MPQNKWKNNCKTLPSGTKFTTLDDVERTLHEDLICDEKGPLCIAGVFGGKIQVFQSILLLSFLKVPILIR
jgi:phenylalanyl-tRNA synthetase beta subunit